MRRAKLSAPTIIAGRRRGESRPCGFFAVPYTIAVFPLVMFVAARMADAAPDGTWSMSGYLALRNYA